ncbi:MAG: UDP-N-acetylglucosamine 1-carboxyvinyltransferase [Candidatus Parcubacteria bacterium]|nr:UDP-N-acetylglucosamine 1-carboxyvinyltransferase [Candidatus Parcubacteria bacterium]
MAEAFVIQGGHSLKGEIEVSGSKNAAIPILAATLLTKEASIIKNVPLIQDILKLIEILESLGVKTEWLDENTIKIDPAHLILKKINQDLVKKIRASVLLMAPLTHRFSSFELRQPGGCVIGARPIDTHILALEALGAKVEVFPDKYFIRRNHLHSGTVVLQEFSVTATENVLMLASLIPGKTILKIAATEPHVEDLIVFLNKMGAKIKNKGSHIYEIEGVKTLHGAKHTLIPDTNEAGTYIVMGIALHSNLLVKNVIPEHLDLVLKKLEEMGGSFLSKKRKDGLSDVQIRPSHQLKAAKIQTQIYPGIPTDLQSVLGVLATQATGSSLLFDTMFEGRLKYIDELNKMGANAIIADPHRAVINGPTALYGQTINSFDIRSGAALIIAALMAQGESIITNAYQVDRGYERLDEKLQKLGANITRKEIFSNQ